VSTRDGEPVRVEVRAVVRLGAFDYRWPADTEHFDYGWRFEARSEGNAHAVEHGVGGREVYGRWRRHTVTWLDGTPRVEGVAVDDFEETRGLLSLIRLPDRTEPRTLGDVPPDYAGMAIVSHRAEIEAPYSRRSLAVKIGLDDLEGWAWAAILRHRILGRG
jgi:hypothetical protein